MQQSAQTRWSLRIGSALGIPIRVHFTFLFLLGWFVVSGYRQGHNPAIAAAFLILVFACVVLHELGHAWAAKFFGVRTREIVLYPIGGLARLDDIPGGKAELVIALAGPLVNLLLFVLLLPVALVLGTGGPAELSRPADLLVWLPLTNLMLFLFNLLPAFPMDGGRVLRAALSLTMSDSRATAIATTVGQAAAIAFAGIGLLLQTPLLMLVALFVFIGASQESFFHRQLVAVRGRVAREAMITRFETLAPQDSLAHAAECLLATHQQDFPVVDAWSRVVGLLPRSVLLEAMARHQPSSAVLEVMDRDLVTVGPQADLNEVLQHLRRRPGRPLIVIENERPLGMITLENLAEFIEISQRTEGT